MRNFLFGLLSGLAVAFLLPVLAVLAWTLGRGEPAVQEDSALVLTLQGDIPEHVDAPMPEFLGWGGGPGMPTLYGVTEAIRAAAEDEDILALVLRCRGAGLGWAKAQELRWAIQEFQESRKPVWAFLEGVGRSDYYVASLADRVILLPESFLDLKGLRVELTFYKGTLDKLGVGAEVVRAGKYKGAGEPFSREEMSDELREVLNEILDEFYGQLLEGIAEARGQDAEHWRGVIDEGPFLADEAERHGLIDGVLHEDLFFKELEDLVSKKELDEAMGEETLRRIGPLEYSRRALRDRRGGARIAVMHAVGAIASGTSWTDPFSGRQEVLGSRTFIGQLDDLREDDGIAGVILRIDSPGGEAVASEQMLRAVRRLAEAKPVVVSMSDVAASGGYYIASAPDVPIVAYPGTYTGSIGVFFLHLNLRGLYDKLGITKETLSRGRFAEIDSDYKRLTDEERERFREYIDAIYDTFLRRVSEGRDMEMPVLRELAQGRVWLGSQAHENNLVDALGGYQRAIALLREAAEIDADEAVRVVSYPPSRGLLEVLWSQGGQAAAGRLFRAPALEGLRRVWTEAAGSAVWSRGGALHLMPYSLSVE